MVTKATSRLEPGDRPAAAAASASQEMPVLHVAGSLARLGDHGAEIPESEIMTMLDRWPGDEDILGAVIARPFLAEATILRLATLAPPKLYERLVRRHALPPGFRRELAKHSRLRPRWWSDALLQHPR